MKWSISWLLMSATVVGMLCIPRGAAASGSIDASVGRITFTGAVVEPTCGASTGRIATWVAVASESGQPHLDACSKLDAVATTSQIYSVTVIHLSNAETDRVLRYFSDYVKANREDPVLITQAYE
jgi:type 1 fimbria pilin